MNGHIIAYTIYDPALYSSHSSLSSQNRPIVFMSPLKELVLSAHIYIDGICEVVMVLSKLFLLHCINMSLQGPTFMRGMSHRITFKDKVF